MQHWQGAHVGEVSMDSWPLQPWNGEKSAGTGGNQTRSNDLYISLAGLSSFMR